METHIIQKFENDWYDNQLRVVIVGRLRSEKNYDSLQALIDDINPIIDWSSFYVYVIREGKQFLFLHSLILYFLFCF